MYQKNRHGWLKHLDFIFLDIICMLLSYIIAYSIRHQDIRLLFASSDYMSMAGIMILANFFIACAFDTMHNVLHRGFGYELLHTFKHVALTFGIIVVYMFTLKRSESFSRIVIYLTFLFHFAIGYSFRLLWKAFIRNRVSKKPRSMLVVTNATSASKVLHDLSDNKKDLSYISGLILTDESDKTPTDIDSIPVKAPLSSAVQYICKNWVDEVFIDPHQHSEEVTNLISECRKMGVTIHDAIAIEDSIGNRQFIEKIGAYQVVTSSVNLASPLQLAIKRVFDILVGILGLCATGVILLFIAPKIKKTSPGPVFFKQDRVGKNGRIFKFIKIRSMYLDAEERKKELMAQNRVADGMMFKMDFDPRIIGNEILPDGTKKTGIGQLIRNTSLDEFPQFWNVLKGDMSLVGTRPPTVDEWEKYDPHHRARLAMKPGITGMWQVSGRSEITDFEEVVKLDTDYIFNWSLGLDLKIIFKTFLVLFKKEGAM